MVSKENCDYLPTQSNGSQSIMLNIWKSEYLTNSAIQ